MNEVAKTEDKLPVLFRKDMTHPELRAITCWMHCGGNRGNFEKMELMCAMNKRGKRPLWHLLHTDKVRRFIDQLVVDGKCLPLVCDKGEIEQELSSQIRKGGNMKAIENLNAMKQYVPKDNSGGGTIVQIMVTGQIGVPEG